MNSFDKLIAQFEKFPGIGVRQARRFVFHILTLPKEEVSELAELITNLQGTVIECTSCRRFFAQNGGGTECAICSDFSRDVTKLMVVERDSDIQAIERAGQYDGLYFVIGGTVPLLEGKEKKPLRGNGLKKVVSERLAKRLSEIILAFSVNPDGENTARYVESLLSDIVARKDLATSVIISHLGRGLSTGSELEYADPETIKNALKSRY